MDDRIGTNGGVSGCRCRCILSQKLAPPQFPRRLLSLSPSHVPAPRTLSLPQYPHGRTTLRSHLTSPLSRILLEDERRVVAAEACTRAERGRWSEWSEGQLTEVGCGLLTEVVRDGRLRLGREGLRRVWHVVEVALGIGSLVVDRWRHDAFVWQGSRGEGVEGGGSGDAVHC